MSRVRKFLNHRKAHPRTYRLHGLCLRSELELSTAHDESGRPDFTVKWGDSARVMDGPPEGLVLAELFFGEGRGFVHVRTPIGYTLRFPAICEFDVDSRRRSMTVHLAPGANPDMAPLLLSGNVTAFLLSMEGECLLHASAVEIDGAAIAFAGQSGGGKSTLAALLCAGGATLVTDDVLRLKFDRTGCRCFPGTLELRLRSGAAQAARFFPQAVQRRTVDKRIAIRPKNGGCRGPSLPSLRAIVIPRLNRTATELRIARLSRPDALFGLTQCPGMLGWQIQEPVRNQFLAIGRATAMVPVYEATIPWGRPHSHQLREALLRGLIERHDSSDAR